MDGCQPTHTIPQVDVVKWDASNFYIKCPYCEEIHRHDLDSYKNGSRTSGCGVYRYAFPFEETAQHVAYEIDKERAWFINICTLWDLDEESDEEEQLASQLSKAKLLDGPAGMSESDICNHEAAQEMVTIKIPGDEAFHEKRILFAISSCVNGEVSQVKEYLRDSPEASIFLCGRDRNGNTSLIMASAEKTSEMVSLLLDHEVNVNAVNNAGRSAIMEAALWGRLENVKLLLGRGADKSWKDNRRSTATDLAQPALKNQRERNERQGASEDTFRRDADRKEIERILSGNNDERKTVYGAPPEARQFKDYSFRRPGGLSISLHGPIAKIPVTRDGKAIALLKRDGPLPTGGQFPPITAMSGWSDDVAATGHLSGKKWTQEVIRVADEVGHVFTPDPQRDQSVPGRFQTCHAEKQLIAYFISRHVFLPSEQIPSRRLEDLIEREDDRIREIYFSSVTIEGLFALKERKGDLERELADEEDPPRGGKCDEKKVKKLKADIRDVEKQLSDLELDDEVNNFRNVERGLEKLRKSQETHQKVIDLSRKSPPVSLTKAVILVSSHSSTICDDCQAFLNQVNSVLGLSIELIECTRNG